MTLSDELQTTKPTLLMAVRTAAGGYTARQFIYRYANQQLVPSEQRNNVTASALHTKIGITLTILFVPGVSLDFWRCGVKCWHCATTIK